MFFKLVFLLDQTRKPGLDSAAFNQSRTPRFGRETIGRSAKNEREKSSEMVGGKAEEKLITKKNPAN